MTDPRILPAEELAEWKAAAERHRDSLMRTYMNGQVYGPRVLRLLEHGKALAEQVDTLARALDEAGAKIVGLSHDVRNQEIRADAAEQERDRARETRDRALRASEDAEQRLADRDQAIRWTRERFRNHWSSMTVADVDEVLDALLAEDEP